MNMRACASGSYSSSTPDASGNPTSYTFTSLTPDGLGLPDVNFRQFQVEEIEVVHSGLWSNTVGSVDSGGTVLTFASAAWTANQFVDRVLSLYYRPNVTTQPVLNLVVSANTATTVTVSASGFLVGDVVVMRMMASTFSDNTIGDSGLVHYSYSSPGRTPRLALSRLGRGRVGTGLPVNGDAGNLIFIIEGAGAGQAPKTIASNNASTFTIVGTWDVMPDYTSVFIVLAPTVAYTYKTKPMVNDGSQTALGIVAITPAVQSQSQQLLISVLTVDSKGNFAPVQYQPYREVAVPAQGSASNATTLTVNWTLAIGTNLANLIYPTTTLYPTGVQMVVKQCPVGAVLTVQLYSGTSLWMTLTIADGATTVSATPEQLADSGGITANQNLTLNITSVGTTFPGSDLSVFIYN